MYDYNYITLLINSVLSDQCHLTTVSETAGVGLDIPTNPAHSQHSLEQMDALPAVDTASFDAQSTRAAGIPIPSEHSWHYPASSCASDSTDRFLNQTPNREQVETAEMPTEERRNH